MNRRWKVLAICFLAAAAGVAVWVGVRSHGQTRQQRTKPIVIGVATWIGYGSLYIAQDKQFFSGADVELRRIDDTAVYNSAMLKGDIDGFCNTLDSFVLAAVRGVDGRIVYSFDESAGADGLVAKPSYKSLSELRGKRIAAQTGWPGHFFMLYLMGHAGLTPGDYTHINLDSDKAGAAFMSGGLDAAVTWEPWLTKIRESGAGRILASSADYPGVIVDALILRPTLLVQRRNDVRILVLGCLKAIEYWRANPEEGNRIVAKQFGLTAEEVASMTKRVRFLDRRQNQDYLRTDGQAVSTLRTALQVWKSAGVIDQAPDLSGTVTDEYVK